jgi:hypothetical protein
VTLILKLDGADLGGFKVVAMGCAWWLIFLIPTTQEAEIGRTVVPGQDRPNVREILSQSISHVYKLDVVAPACGYSYSGGINRRTNV